MNLMTFKRGYGSGSQTDGGTDTKVAEYTIVMFALNFKLDEVCNCSANFSLVAP